MTNPFDDEVGTFVVVANHEGQHAIWPAPAAVPGGWSTVHGPSDRGECLQYVMTHWTDQRPQTPVPARNGA